MGVDGFADIKVAMEGLIAKSGAAQAEYFEGNARRIAEALGLTLTKKHGVLTLPDLYDAALALHYANVESPLTSRQGLARQKKAGAFVQVSLG